MLESAVMNMCRKSTGMEHPTSIHYRLMTSLRGRIPGSSKTRAHKSLIQSLSKPYQRKFSTVRSSKQSASIIPSGSNSVALKSSTSDKPSNGQHRMLEFDPSDKDSTEEIEEPKCSFACADGIKACNSQSADVVTLKSPASYSRQQSEILHLKHVKTILTKDSAEHVGNDLEDGKKGKHEDEGFNRLSSFTIDSMGASSQPRAGGKRSLVRQLSSESCISMPSLDCREDVLRDAEWNEPCPSDDTALERETSDFSSHCQEDKFHFDNEALFSVGGSNSNADSRLVCDSEEGQTALKSSISTLPPLLKKRNPEKDHPEKVLKRFKCNNKGLSSSYGRQSLRGTKIRKKFLKLQYGCRGLAGFIGKGTDLADVFHLGIGFGASYVITGTWKMLNKLNVLLERTEYLVKDLQQHAPTSKQDFSSNTQKASRQGPEVFTESIQPGTARADEMAAGSMNMADLEAALEVELGVMQKNLEAELQAAAGGSEVAKHPSIKDTLKIGDDKVDTAYYSTTENVPCMNYMVSPSTLSERLHEIIEMQQNDRILQLEKEIQARELDFTMKEMELQCWKDIAYYLVDTLPAKSGRFYSFCEV
ncbi:hypothetical protein KP509_06G000300 [Ceratopteris richardii]|uniref:Uncharacterized protein n=1 Tax=Ceratopteris richardii TaxID=49495 RepID=A0A8T2UHH9_CERRI|nr:hypothetical protein KP509_06G000300 [Ceratopteris richardii]